MTTLAVALAEIAALKARVDALEAAAGTGTGAASGGAGASSSGGVQRAEPLGDHQLDKAWANKKIAKDPKKWKGPTQVNRTYSRAPKEWLDLMAEHYEFKAQKGREENPPRLRNDGKPWHESDFFEAKLLRAWAARAASRPPSRPKTHDDFGGGDGFGGGQHDTGFGAGDDEVPF